MGILGAATNLAISSSPAGKAYQAAKTALAAIGVGEHADAAGVRLVRKLYNRVLAYDLNKPGARDAVRQLDIIQRNASRDGPGGGYGSVRQLARRDLNSVAVGIDGAGRTLAPELRELARTLWQPEGAPWVSGNGAVPGVDSGSPPEEATPKKKSGSSAPRAPKPKPPCKWGLRLPNGKCPTKAEAQQLGLISSSGGSSRPCKYGPRGADGYCPKKPASTRAKKLTKVQSAALRRAQTAAGNILAAGARGAIKAAQAGMAAAGVGAGAAAATIVAVVGAAMLGWFIGQKILHQGEDKQQQKAYAAVDRVHARLALQDQLGRMPTLEEQKGITAAYNERLRQIDLGIT